MRLTVVLLAATLSCGCVTSGNLCGNETREWNNLSYPKGNYCSVPRWLPFKTQYEAANKAVCKVHDNNSGQASRMELNEADHRFLCDYIKRSKLPWGFRHTTGYLSYWSLRLRAGARHSNRMQKRALAGKDVSFQDCGRPAIQQEGIGSTYPESSSPPRKC